MKRFVRRLIIVSMSFLFALGLAEVLIRIAGLGEKGSIGVLYEYSARFGWVHKPHAEMAHVSDEFDVTWRFNNRGFRDEEDVDATARGRCVLVLGDSHTAGHGVETTDTFAHQIEQQWNRNLRVLNLGVDGYTTSQQLLQLESFIDEFDPRGVVLGVYPANDFRENLEGRGLGGFPRPIFDASLNVKPLPPGERKHGEAGWVRRTKDFLSESSKLYVFVGNALKNGPLHEALSAIGLMSPPPEDRVRQVVERCYGAYGQCLWQCTDTRKRTLEGMDRTIALISRLQERCAENATPLLIIVIPVRIQVQGDPAALLQGAKDLGVERDPRDIVREYHELFLEKCHQEGLDIVDILGEFRKSEDTLYYPVDWHLTPQGHEKIAEIVVRESRIRGWFE